MQEDSGRMLVNYMTTCQREALTVARWKKTGQILSFEFVREIWKKALLKAMKQRICLTKKPANIHIFHSGVKKTRMGMLPSI
jgi:hypothetical protein